MAPPRSLWRVEWTVARRFDTPHDRVRRSANFQSPRRAAAQARSVLGWPTHASLDGCWRTGSSKTAALKWIEVDVERLLEDHLSPEDAERYSVLETSRVNTPALRAAIAEVMSGEEIE